MDRVGKGTKNVSLSSSSGGPGVSDPPSLLSFRRCTFGLTCGSNNNTEPQVQVMKLEDKIKTRFD